MGEKIDNFVNALRENLNVIDDRLQSVKATIGSTSKETQATVQSKLDEVKTKLNDRQHELEQYKAKLAVQAEELKAKAESNVQEMTTSWKISELNRRASAAEEYATTAIAVAVAAIDEAEEAILMAIAAKLDADEESNRSGSSSS
jgi:archaellum component FlaC